MPASAVLFAVVAAAAFHEPEPTATAERQRRHRQKEQDRHPSVAHYRTGLMNRR
jgi:hypothetical protein